MMTAKTFPTLASQHQRRYGSPVAAKSATRVWRPGNEIGARAPHPIAGAFFVPAVSSYGGCAWETERSAGFQFPRFANLRTAATHRLATVGASSTIEIGASPMRTTLSLSPSKSHAAAWKARALAALRADSSLSVRLRRYNDAMARARAIEAVGGAQ